MANPWRKIVGSTRTQEEHSSKRGRQFTWWVVMIHTLTLECGHQIVKRGDCGIPTTKVRCAECGKEPSCHPSAANV